MRKLNSIFLLPLVLGLILSLATQAQAGFCLKKGGYHEPLDKGWYCTDRKCVNISNAGGYKSMMIFNDCKEDVYITGTTNTAYKNELVGRYRYECIYNRFNRRGNKYVDTKKNRQYIC